MKSSSSLSKKSRSSVTRLHTSKTAPAKSNVRKTEKKSSSPVVSRIKRRSKVIFKSLLLSKSFQTSAKMVMMCVVAGSSAYGLYHLVGRTFANEVVISKSEIVSRVSKLTALPPYDPDDVVRVEDENNLRKQNAFYRDIKEGDYIIMYKDMAVIYDLRNNTIVAMRKAVSTEDIEQGMQNGASTSNNGQVAPQESSTSNPR